MGVVAMNELVDLAKKTKKECFIFKVDFKKGYDLISWSFLDYILSFYQMARWDMCLYFSSNLAILVNGFPTEVISIQRGLKQGDPLSLFF